MLRRLSLCAALVALTVPLGQAASAAEPDRTTTEGADAARPTPRTSQVSRQARRPAATTPLTVTIDELTPSTIPDRGTVRVSGTVANTDAETWRRINVYSFVSAEPLTSTQDLALAVASDPTAAVGDRIVEPGSFDSLAKIAPGETVPFTFTVHRNQLEADTAGVYWFGVHALGEGAEGRDLLADGRARTFLPFVPPGRSGEVAVSIVVPLRHRLDRLEDGSLADVPGWTRTLSTDGRLSSLVEFGAAAGSRTISWVVDPALIDAVRRLAAGNPPRSLAPTVEPGQDDGEEESPTEDVSPGEGDAALITEPSPVESDLPGAEDPAELDPETRAAAVAAQAWLDSLAEALRGGDELLALPFGDTDVSGAARHDPAAYQLARQRAGDVLAPFGLRSSPVVASPSGFLSPGGLRTVEPETTVLVTDQMFGSSPPAVAETSGRTIVVTSTGAVAGGPGPEEARTMLAMRQRLLAEAAVRFLTPRRPPLVVQLPPDWRPGSTLGFFSGLDVDWLHLTSVGQAAATARVRPVEIGRLRYPESQAEAELDDANFTAADELAGAGASLQNVLTLNDVVAVEVTDEALGSVSYSARLSPDAARAAASRSETWIDDQLDKVRVQAPTAVTLSSSAGRFAATVRNELDQPVTVGLQAQSDSELVVESAPEIDVPAKGRTTVLLNAETDENGIHDVTLVLTDPTGTPLGGTTDLSVRSAQVSNVIWLFIGGGLALLFGAIGVRLVRRVRASLRGGAHSRGNPEHLHRPKPDDTDSDTAVSAGAASQ